MASRPNQNYSEADLLQRKTNFQSQLPQLQARRKAQIRVTKDPFHESVREIDRMLQGVYDSIGAIDQELAARRSGPR
jgi:hypothetical protein